MSSSYSDLAPNYQLYIEGKPVEFPNRVQSVEFDQTIGLSDKLQLKVSNKDLELTDHRALQSGNNVDLYGGYGTQLEFMGRTIFSKHLPKFPANGMPTLIVQGSDFSFKLMDEESAIKSSPTKHSKLDLAKDEEGHSFVEMTHSSMVEQIAAKWGLEPDIDATTKVDTLIQKKGTSDYKFIRGLANVNDRDLWIDWDHEVRTWVLHWRKSFRNQTKVYTFEYVPVEGGTLLNFEPSYGMREDITELKVLYYDLETEEWKSIDLKETGGDIADPRLFQGTGDDVEEPINNASSIRIEAAGHSIDVVPDRVLHSAEEAQTFAEAWFRARKDHFIVGRGRVVGLENLKPRQVHTLLGLGNRLSGDYEFTSVKHVFGQGGYVCHFVAHKVMVPTDAVP